LLIFIVVFFVVVTLSILVVVFALSKGLVIAVALS
jgi:hypothetical protein